jgi:hypothetical protein
MDWTVPNSRDPATFPEDDERCILGEEVTLDVHPRYERATDAWFERPEVSDIELRTVGNNKPRGPGHQGR